MSNDPPNLKNVLRTRYNASSMLEATLSIFDANYNADSSNSEIMGESSDDTASESLHCRPSICKYKM